MFAPKPYREKAFEYGELVKQSTGSDDKRKFRKLEQSFTVLADNEQWLADNHRNTVHAPERVGPPRAARAEEEEHILRCLGAAVIIQWSTLPVKLQRELFDHAGSMGELLETAALRGQIARFLHRNNNGGTQADSANRQAAS